MNTHLIQNLSHEEEQISQALTAHIVQEIQLNNGITFAEFMQMVLYTPQFGYYTNGRHKIGASGDFITAPTLTPLFGQTLAQQIFPLLPQTAANIYEFGAGTGHLAAQLLNTLNDRVQHYYIIELSADLTQCQQEYIAQHAPKAASCVTWLSELPELLDGIIIGNEVLDAMPIERIRRNADGTFSHAYVMWQDKQFFLDYRPLSDVRLLEAAEEYFPNVSNYVSELHPIQYAFIQTLSQKLTRGAMIWLDYGFDSTQYYHPQRHDGTLIGHHRHHSIHDPFYRIGFTDLTTHVNFSHMAAAACNMGLDLIGYTNQAHFLFNLGILDLLAQRYPNVNQANYIQAAQAVHMLTATQEMGELFKVMAVGKNIDVDWQGFIQGDLCHKL